MLSPELRELTASEPLTLDEEYAMQSLFSFIYTSTRVSQITLGSWQIDNDSETIPNAFSPIV